MNMLRIMASALLCASAFTATQVCALEYPLPPANSRLIGENQEYTVPNDGQPLEAIAAKFQLGLTNMLEANPGVDPYLPRAGSVLKIPHQLILPDAPREGIVINVAEMRLYYYPKGRNVVEVLPIGIGQLGTDTPENWVTSVQRKRANPTWTPTAKVHAEYAAKGEKLPAVWPAGPDNPMGLYALYIGRLYAIHGTNASFGIGLRVSHGCVRLRNDDIEYLFSKRDSLILVAQNSPEFTARIVDRWQELEAQQGPKLPTTMAEALRLAADQAEQIEKQQAALAIAAPKAAFVDQYVDASGLKGFRQVAKLLKANENHFRLFLIENKVMYRLSGEWVAYQNHIDAGRFSVKTGEANGHAFTRSMFTPKGVEWVAGEFAKFQLAQNEEVPA